MLPWLLSTGSAVAVDAVNTAWATLWRRPAQSWEGRGSFLASKQPDSYADMTGEAYHPSMASSSSKRYGTESSFPLCWMGSNQPRRFRRPQPRRRRYLRRPQFTRRRPDRYGGNIRNNRTALTQLFRPHRYGGDAASSIALSAIAASTTALDAICKKKTAHERCQRKPVRQVYYSSD